ncbi:interleukin-20-like, partial [Sphaerodactylus townsendi]|uniref:interleukin-20-like n=1 Tax=Sphaerodactylus townsendi TaxID=933632 RepID=UPI002026041E
MPNYPSAPPDVQCSDEEDGFMQQSELQCQPLVIWSSLDYPTMIAMGPYICIAVLSFLFGTSMTKERKMLQFGQCELSGISFRELNTYFDEIKETIQTQDNRTDVILLKESVLLHTPVSESCCLLRHLLRFYIESVFRHYEATSNTLKRKTSPLANTFLHIKTTLRQC